MTSRHASEEGSGLVMAFLTITVLMVLGMAMMGITYRSNVQVTTSIEDKDAVYLAEAAIGEAVTAIRKGSTGSIGSKDAPAYLGGGAIWVEATDLGGDKTRLIACAMVGKGRAAFEAIVQTSGGSLFSNGVASKDFLLIKNDGMFDAYDSNLGTYASQVPAGDNHALDGVTVLSNTDIDLTNSAIHGDVHPGPGASITQGGGVTGSTTPLAVPFDLPEITVPSLPAGAALTLASGVTKTLAPGNYRFSSVSIGKGAHLIIEDPSVIVIDDSYTMLKDAILTAGGSGSTVEIYIGGDVATSVFAEINTPDELPSSIGFYFYGEDQDVEIQPHSDFYGTFYGPKAYIRLGTKLELHGAVAARKLYFQPHSRFHFDLALTRVGGGTPAVNILHWEETGFPDQNLMNTRRDAFEALGVHPDKLLSPSEAWDIDVHEEYRK